MVGSALATEVGRPSDAPLPPPLDGDGLADCGFARTRALGVSDSTEAALDPSRLPMPSIIIDEPRRVSDDDDDDIISAIELDVVKLPTMLSTSDAVPPARDDSSRIC